jgi:NADP-dependent 3-hydroxy acid dehydrogenase YdfG
MMVNDTPVILITGASSGIGEAAAHFFSAAGYRLALAARRLERLQALADEVQAAGGEALAVQTDVSHLADIENMVDKTMAAYGRIDVLFNNAGIGRIKWLEELDPDKDIQQQIQVNLTGAILTARSVLPVMMKQRSGHIINMASMAGQTGTPTYTVYAATKFGLRGFSEALRRETVVWGIKVSTIYPGGVATEFASHLAKERKTGITTPKSMLLTVESVAETVLRIAQVGRSREVILPPVNRLVVWLNRFFPWLVDWTIERNFTRPERGM